MHGQLAVHFSLYLCLALIAAHHSTRASAALLPEQGCPMAHCDPQLSDLVHLPAPTGEVSEIWHRNDLPSERAGSRQGLGCSGNGVIVACTYSGMSDNLVVYDYDGNRLWSSGEALNANAYTSAPLVYANGDVVACDNTRVIRFDNAGQLVWSASLQAGGVPISPVITESGVLILATFGGPIYALDSSDGTMLGHLYVRKDQNDPGFFETLNTPAVRGNRLYVSTQHQVDGIPDSDNLAWLVAIDVDPAAPTVDDRLKVAWHYEFGGQSGASPLIIGRTIYFDGDRPAPGTEKAPHIFAVSDNGTSPVELWRKRALSKMNASFARDPRPAGGFWTYSLLSPWLIRLHQLSGRVMQAIDVDNLLGEEGRHIPRSAMTIAGTDAEPVMIILATALNSGATYVIAVNLMSHALVWKVEVTDIAWAFTAGQFPIVMQNGVPRVVFTTFNAGARAIGTVIPK